MILGIPRGYFYYDYYGFIERLFGSETDEIQVILGEENNDETLMNGNDAVVDEACLPIKLAAGQVKMLAENCDFVLIPRIMKDIKGRWLCPKLLGLPELLAEAADEKKLMITEPLNFNKKSEVRRVFWQVCYKLGMDKKTFMENFRSAYEYQRKISYGNTAMHVEAAWEFTPTAAENEIILPNTGKVLVLGHIYNVFDKFSNGNVMDKLDELCIEAVTEGDVLQSEKEKSVEDLGLIKKPFWEALIRMLGAAVALKSKVEGIVYLSSFSCGMDAFIIDMIKEHVNDIPIMVLKLDEHKGTAGFDTRLEAFADLLERRRAS